MFDRMNTPGLKNDITSFHLVTLSFHYFFLLFVLLFDTLFCHFFVLSSFLLVIDTLCCHSFFSFFLLVLLIDIFFWLLFCCHLMTWCTMEFVHKENLQGIKPKTLCSLVHSTTLQTSCCLITKCVGIGLVWWWKLLI